MDASFAPNKLCISTATLLHTFADGEGWKSWEVFISFLVWRATLLFRSRVYFCHPLHVRATSSVANYVLIQCRRNRRSLKEEKNRTCGMMGKNEKRLLIEKSTLKNVTHPSNGIPRLYQEKGIIVLRK
jgi:hypothetical protein